MADRRFAPISAYAGKVSLPERKTASSAGYDLAAAADTTVEPGKVALVPTGLKAYMAPDEVLLLYIRSSLAVKRSLMLANGVGVVDADYADNPDNEGHIMVALANLGGAPVTIAAGDRIAQGIFVKYLATAGDQAGGDRLGGFGSTGQN
ncbi:MAG TPA: dUTP diphosphatase [Symbiobacteriaceae bacterium]|nr:dUTP diphosphatase [Symbiobacteriaceae bacterium]